MAAWQRDHQCPGRWPPPCWCITYYRRPAATWTRLRRRGCLRAEWIDIFAVTMKHVSCMYRNEMVQRMISEEPRKYLLLSKCWFYWVISTESKIDFAQLYFSKQISQEHNVTLLTHSSVASSPTGLCESDVYFILDAAWRPGRIKTFQSTDLKREFSPVITSCCWPPLSDVWGLPQGKTTKQIKKGKKMHNVRSCPDACQSWLKRAYRGGCSTLENRVKISRSS